MCRPVPDNLTIDEEVASHIISKRLTTEITPGSFSLLQLCRVGAMGKLFIGCDRTDHRIDMVLLIFPRVLFQIMQLDSEDVW